MKTLFNEKKSRYLTLLLIIGWTLVAVSGLQAQLKPDRLRCEHLENPFGIDVTKPRLSWQLIAPQGERGQRQSAWRILAASSRHKLDRNEGDLWDSGKVVSEQSILVPYEGAPLSSRQRCWWKVMAWDVQDHSGPWSPPAFWEMALLDRNDWHAKWIASSAEETSPPPTEPTPMFRREFEVEHEIRQAQAYVTGLGYFELSVNGRQVATLGRGTGGNEDQPKTGRKALPERYGRTEADRPLHQIG